MQVFSAASAALFLLIELSTIGGIIISPARGDCSVIQEQRPTYCPLTPLAYYTYRSLSGAGISVLGLSISSNIRLIYDVVLFGTPLYII